MQSDDRRLALTSLAMAFVMALGCVTMFDASDADTVDYDQDLGQFWSYTVQFVFNGSNAQSINWDFGDGSAPSTEFNPRHEFPSKGVYTVTQTTTNTMGETVEHYRVEIMGFPYITLVYDNGSPENGTIQQAAYKVAAVRPADPVKDDCNFMGWFTDPECTTAYDWSAPVAEPITLYAGWSEMREVVFVLNNGSENLVVSVGTDGKVKQPFDPVKEGYTFTGWYTDPACTQVFDFATTIDSSLTLYAGWEAVSGPSDDDKDAEKDEIHLYAAIASFVVAAILVVAAIMTGSIYIAIPAVILAIIGMVAGLLHGGVI